MADELDRSIKRLIRKLRDISRVEIPRANASALNKVSKRVQTRTVRGVAERTRIKQKDIRKRTFIARATSRKQTARLRAYPKPISATRLLTQNQLANRVGTGTNKRGVKTRGYEWRGAFIQRGKSNNLHVFRRKGAARFPVEVIKVDISKPLRQILPTVAQREMKQNYKRLLENDLKFRLRKYVKR